MTTHIFLKDGADDFSVSLIQPPDAFRTVLFAVGGGGHPGRHMPLLHSLAGQGCTVIAPHFDRIMGGPVPAPELARRIRRVHLALSLASAQPLYAVGHSIGAAILLGLAGGRIWLHGGQRLDVETDHRIARMVLFTPAMDFFAAPGALDAVRTPMQVWAGARDTMTPPSQTAFLKSALGPLVEARVMEEAGHFSFMNALPPNIVDSVADRDAFLADVARETGKFLFS